MAKSSKRGTFCRSAYGAGCNSASSDEAAVLRPAGSSLRALEICERRSEHLEQTSSLGFIITTSAHTFDHTLVNDNGGSRGGARERAHPRLRKFFNVQTIFKHVSMCVRNLLGACIDASAAVQRLCPLCHVHV